MAGAAQALCGSLHLGVVAEGSTGCSGEGSQDEAVEPHGHHQPGTAGHRHRLAGPLCQHLPAAASQPRRQQLLLVKLLQQAPVLGGVEGEPDHLAVLQAGQLVEGLEIGVPGRSLQLFGGA